MTNRQDAAICGVAHGVPIATARVTPRPSNYEFRRLSMVVDIAMPQPGPPSH
jgi:hypothetical protein